MKGKALFVVLLLALFIVRPIYPQQLTSAQAKNHEGETATVCGVVASEHTATSSRGQPTFINLDAPYPNQVFTILVWGEDRRNIGALPQSNSRICVTGLITDYRGVPEIVLKSKQQLTLKRER